MLMLGSPAAGDVQLAQLTIEQRVIIRVPLARARGRVQAPPPVAWDEKKGPKCVAIRSIRQANIIVDDGIDMLMVDGKRFRARLERGCQSVNFWSGFYIEPTKDGSLCAGRDAIQARGGTECEIDTFRKLVPEE
ncbi:MAG: hypothetical protein DI547_15860 [Sphingobium sp.]|jgi:hypothetical protein|nr:MAG: hypothetical protein DI547_15860 [Sphingobium sp.]